MKISIQCGQCGKQYQVKSELAGKKVKCQDCGTSIPVPAGGESQAEAPAKKASPAPAKAPVAKTAPAAKAAPAKKPAAAAAAPAPAPAPLQHNILDEAMATAARLPATGEMYCPGCKSIIPAASVICVTCGFDLQSGRSTRVYSEGSRSKRRPGQRPALGILVALVSVLYGLAGAALFTLLIVLAVMILVKLGLPTAENPESVFGMFGMPVFILLATAGLLMFISGIGIFRSAKGATLNAGLGAKIYVWTFLLLMAIVGGRAIYTSTQAYKEKAEQAAAQTAEKEKPTVDLGHAEAVSATRLLGFVKLAFLPLLIGITMLLIGPPAFVWAWAATQGRRWDWELPEPVHKLRLKPTPKVHGPQAPPEKK
jgi:predicted Zn finger-like uncharacterized protein